MAMPNCRGVRSLTLALATAVFLGLGAAPAAAKEAGEVAPQGPAPPLPAVESLQLEPASLTLLNARDSRQVLVWGVTKDGQRFDLSGDATFKAESAAISVGADRYVSPVAAGEGQVTVSAAGKTAQLPVKVLSGSQPPVGFIADVMPAMARS